MGYGGLKLGTANSSINDRISLPGRTKAESLQGREKAGTATSKKKVWEEEEHLRTLRDVRALLARGPPVVQAAAAAAAAASEESENTEEEWQEREGGLRQRETLQQFSNWICEERASKTLVGGRGERYKDFGTFVGGSFRGNNGSEMCKKIYDRERERCKVTNGTVIDVTPLPRRNATSRPTVRRNQSTI